MKKMNLNKVAILVIKFYKKYISRFTFNCCKFQPTCSAYGLLAYQRYGFIKATRLTIWRILRCNPFNKGGIDNL